jgi:acyl-CoA synthetase (AMP-forming)/AMP-acid ligase II
MARAAGAALQGPLSIATLELLAHCRERLARYKCPTSIDRVAALPRNPSGRILIEKDLREPYWAGRQRRIN